MLIKLVSNQSEKSKMVIGQQEKSGLISPQLIKNKAKNFLNGVRIRKASCFCYV
jgi:hypothetical protein